MPHGMPHDGPSGRRGSSDSGKAGASPHQGLLVSPSVFGQGSSFTISPPEQAISTPLVEGSLRTRLRGRQWSGGPTSAPAFDPPVAAEQAPSVGESDTSIDSACVWGTSQLPCAKRAVTGAAATAGRAASDVDDDASIRPSSTRMRSRRGFAQNLLKGLSPADLDARSDSFSALPWCESDGQSPLASSAFDAASRDGDSKRPEAILTTNLSDGDTADPFLVAKLTESKLSRRSSTPGVATPSRRCWAGKRSSLPGLSRTRTARARGRYRKGRLLGAGATGKVYEAHDQLTGQFVAMKEIVGGASKAEAVREIETLQTLQHPNIVRYIDCADQRLPNGQGTRLLVYMELVDGGSLLSLVQEFGSLTDTVLQHYTPQIVEGLRYLHQRGVVHSDIKPANLLVTTGGVVKVADFGASKRRMNDASADAGSSAEKEAPHDGVGVGKFVGTPAYASPESIQGHNTVESDVWEMGMTIYELSVGVPPWERTLSYDNPFELLRRVVLEDVTPALPEDMSDGLRGFLGRCFVRDPKMRGTLKELAAHPFLRAGAAYRTLDSGALLSARTMSFFHEQSKGKAAGLSLSSIPMLAHSDTSSSAPMSASACDNRASSGGDAPPAPAAAMPPADTGNGESSACEAWGEVALLNIPEAVTPPPEAISSVEDAEQASPLGSESLRGRRGTVPLTLDAAAASAVVEEEDQLSPVFEAPHELRGVFIAACCCNEDIAQTFFDRIEDRSCFSPAKSPSTALAAPFSPLTTRPASFSGSQSVRRPSAFDDRVPQTAHAVPIRSVSDMAAAQKTYAPVRGTRDGLLTLKVPRRCLDAAARTLSALSGSSTPFASPKLLSFPSTILPVTSLDDHAFDIPVLQRACSKEDMLGSGSTLPVAAGEPCHSPGQHSMPVSNIAVKQHSALSTGGSAAWSAGHPSGIPTQDVHIKFDVFFEGASPKKLFERIGRPILANMFPVPGRRGSAGNALPVGATKRISLSMTAMVYSGETLTAIGKNDAGVKFSDDGARGFLPIFIKKLYKRCGQRYEVYLSSFTGSCRRANQVFDNLEGRVLPKGDFAEWGVTGPTTRKLMPTAEACIRGMKLAQLAFTGVMSPYVFVVEVKRKASGSGAGSEDAAAGGFASCLVLSLLYGRQWEWWFTGLTRQIRTHVREEDRRDSGASEPPEAPQHHPFLDMISEVMADPASMNYVFHNFHTQADVLQVCAVCPFPATPRLSGPDAPPAATLP
eukprot:TRINITY_DN7424_c0_g1_i1.p1 TRINITY_DN7424_c0_g1~~TRINITY_DN7424_c0_g1_i1.p1  ORF type:complete len:1258 (+),score=285.99 TRINITY_DN7424_c0_g1_i1:99-3776(+)